MGTWIMFETIDDVVGGWFTWANTLLSGNLWSVIIMTLAFAFVSLIIYFIYKAIRSR